MSRYALVIDSFCCVIGFQRDEQREREREGGRDGDTHLDSVDNIKSPRIGQIEERLADDLLGEFKS